jgi:hypothetical protein
MTWIEVLQRSSEGYRVRIIRDDGWEQLETIESMGSELFETCLRTGYFYPDKELDRQTASVTA